MRSKREILFGFVRGGAAIFVALAVAIIFIFICSDTPGKAIEYLLVKPILNTGVNGISFNASSFYIVLSRMIPTIFTGLAVCVMFSSNQFNLAGEGAVMLGGFVAALCGIYWTMPAGVHVTVCVLMGALSCGVVMLLPALLKTKLGASEMVSSLMLNYVIQYVVLHFLNNDFADRSKGSTQTFPFAETAKVPDLVPGTDLTWGFVVALVVTVLVAIFMYRTRWGYAIRMIGINKDFSKYSGIKVGAIIVLSQVVGGFISGMSGSIEVLGRFDTFLWRELPGYGWTGVTIAILAKNNPVYVPIAAFFMAYLERGCELMRTFAGVPSEMLDIIQAVIFLFFAAEQFLAGYRQKIVVKGAKEELARQSAGAAQEKGAKA